ncbi:MAG: crotonase/enoyl-CoA hydratase family protein [Parasphingorhabdus sp.]|uniref:crotonase/enoyl-CoA hydratase family protein n=1 Tax=Parasphingorhabdus sp. TaxID=2709688 RepID=UPI003297781B
MSITVDIQSDVALITMDDGKANAVNFDLMAALNDTLDQAESDAKAIVLAGREGRFSGGFDLKAMANFKPDDAAVLLDRASELLLRLYGGPLPVVGACTGHAIAMGTFLLLACDTRIGADGDFKLGANESATGMTLPVFALELARDRLSPRHLTRAMIQAFIYNPKGAVDAGYLDMLSAPEKVVEQSLAIAGQLTALSTRAYAYQKTALRKPTLDAIRASIGNHPNL